MTDADTLETGVVDQLDYQTRGYQASVSSSPWTCPSWPSCPCLPWPPLRHHQRLLLPVELVRDVGKRARVEVRALQQVIQAVLTAQRGLLLLMVQDRHDAHA